MKTLLKVAGGGWALIGAVDILLMPWGRGTDGILAFGLFLNFVFFLFPGLVLCGIGAMIAPTSTTPVPLEPVKGLPTEEEWQAHLRNKEQLT